MTEKTVIYTDLGVTKGMEQAIKSAELNGVEVERRKLNNDDWELYFHETLSLQPAPGKVVWSEVEDFAGYPEPPPNRIIKEDIEHMKYLAWILPILLLTVIAVGIADKVGWL
jgi:hypothetical protein